MNITFACLLSYNLICICLRCDKVVCNSDIAQNCMKISRLHYGYFIVPAGSLFIPAFCLYSSYFNSIIFPHLLFTDNSLVATCKNRCTVFHFKLRALCLLKCFIYKFYGKWLFCLRLDNNRISIPSHGNNCF